MTEIELQILKFFHGFAQYFEGVTALFTELGGEMILFLLIAVIFFGIDKQKGETLAFTVLFSTCINGIIKCIVRRPRPFTQDSTIASLKQQELWAGTYSFPSGHSQNAASMYTGIYAKFQNKIVRGLCIAAMILVPFTRMFLGVHYPTDVLVGTALGAGIAVGCVLLLNRFHEKRYFIYLVTAGALVLVLLTVYFPLSFFGFVDVDTVKAIGALAGFSAGVWLQHKYFDFDSKGVWWKRLLRIGLGIAFLIGFRYGLKALFGLMSDYFLMDFLRYFLTIFLVIGVYPALIKACKLG